MSKGHDGDGCEEYLRVRESVTKVEMGEEGGEGGVFL